MQLAATTPVSEALAILGYLIGVAGAIFWVLGNRAKTTSDQQDKSITALSGRLSAAQDEIRELKSADEHKERLLADKQLQLNDLQTKYDALKDAVDSQALLLVGFTELGVDRDKLQAAIKGGRRA